ncbi:MAG: rhodanese-like domain-containing protein, partial [Petrimonas sp.]|nr:rhodanese-like domain-containing protein [Petrimonas sp.]
MPESNFNAFRETLYQLSPELDGLRLNIAIDDDGKSFWVLRCKVPSNTFREQLPMAVEMLKENKDKNIVMYCTGGIRCEKASAYLRYKGFPHVFHVEGGVIEYARKARE